MRMEVEGEGAEDLARGEPNLVSRAIEAFAAELIDRFGPLPAEVENLLQTVALKKLCREAGIEKVEAGAKGAVLSFRRNEFANPAGMVQWITGHEGTAKLRRNNLTVGR